jgi:hypothetical protein
VGLFDVLPSYSFLDKGCAMSDSFALRCEIKDLSKIFGVLSARKMDKTHWRMMMSKHCWVIFAEVLLIF